MASRAEFLKARIERIVKAFTQDDAPELREFISGLQPAEGGAIDDGAYGDPLRDPRPDFIKEEEQGWDSLVVLKR